MPRMNPAQKLLEEIAAFRKTAFYPLYHDKSALSVWKSVWRVDNESQAFQKIIDLHRLVIDIENAIRLDPHLSNKERYLRWVPEFKKTLLPTNLLNKHSVFLSSVYSPDTTHMVSLDFCSDALSKSFFDKPIDDQVIKNLKTQLEELFLTIKAEITDSKARGLLLDLLVGIEFGLRNYEIRGSIGLEEALDLALGKILRRRTEYNDISKSESGGVFQKISSFLKNASEVVDSSKKVADGLSLAGSAFEQVISTLSPP